MNYRKMYQVSLGVTLSKDFDVHHIDFNRFNNELKNLVALPRKLHQKYHEIASQINVHLPVPLRNTGGIHVTAIIHEYLELYDECNKWMTYKDHFITGIPNIYNLSYS